MSLNPILAAMLSDIDEIADEMEAGRITADTFQTLMAQSLTEHSLAAYLSGRGVTRLDEAGRDFLGESIGAQLEYLDKFADKIAADGWQPAMRARAKMYAGSIKIPYSAGQTELLPLPGYPAEGTECYTNCGCSWDKKIVDAARGHYDFYWRRGKDDSCATCIDREREWAPFRIRFGEAA